jgi:acetyltransferase-like isoleucine patch superfamily enzyme
VPTTLKNTALGNNITIYPNVSFPGSGEIIIGDNVDIGEGTLIYSHNRVVIGYNVAIAGQCYLIDCNHGIEKSALIRVQTIFFDDDGTSIGNDVWISAGCKIIKGARIADGAVIGVMSLVNSNISAYSIAVGIPAKKIKERC